MSKYRLGLDDVEPDIFGRAYEYPLRKFAGGSGQSAGEFYTPREVGLLIAYLLDPEEGEEISRVSRSVKIIKDPKGDTSSRLNVEEVNPNGYYRLSPNKNNV